MSEPRSTLEDRVIEAALGARDDVRRPALRPPPDAGMLLAD